MKIGPRIAVAIAAALVAGFGFRYYDMTRGAEWVVSPAQIAAAKAAGKPGVSTAPGTVAVLPVRSETADFLPFEWLLAGLGAGALVFIAAGKADRVPRPRSE